MAKTHAATTAIVALVASALHPAGARAEILEDAIPIVQRYVEATGGRERLAAERTLHLKGRIEAIGLRGRWELWTAAPDRWTRRFTLGSLRFREGFDGTVAWRTDLTDKSVQVLSDAERERAREEGWFLCERWALDDQGGVPLRKRSMSFGNRDTYDVMEVTPPSGRSRQLSVSQKTGFVVRVLHEVDQHIVTEQPGEYKRLAGRKRATVYESPTLVPGDKPIERMVVDSAWANVALDSSIFSPPARPERPIAWQGTRSSVRVPFGYAAKSVLVKVSINGAPPADFIFDTGASLTAIDKDYAYALGLRPEGEAAIGGIAGAGETRFARVKSIALNGPKGAAVRLSDFRAALLDLAEGGKVMLWQKPMGILGADFLSRFVVEIDYDALAITLHDPARYQYTAGGAAIPFELSGGCPLVNLTLDHGCAGKFLVDVGNSFHFVVHGSLVRSCRLFGAKQRRQVEVNGGGVGGGFTGTLCRLDSLRIGPYAWPEPVAALTLYSSGSIGSREIAGNIGNSVLERFRCTFDYPRHTLYLEPGRRFSERDRVSRFGALFALVGTRVVAGEILIGSAADEAGLHWFDVIVAVDGKPLERWTRDEIDRLLEEGEEGSEHSVTYRRFDLPEKTVTVKLKDVL
jgi:Aspartyl protease